jgi:RHS repeat-associated protein
MSGSSGSTISSVNTGSTTSGSLSASATTTVAAMAADTPYLYVGAYGVASDANGLAHMRARYYHPRLARFLNADPIRFGGGMNWYRYVDGNPISLVDPLGLEAVAPNPTQGKAISKAIDLLDKAGIDKVSDELRAKLKGGDIRVDKDLLFDTLGEVNPYDPGVIVINPYYLTGTNALSSVDIAGVLTHEWVHTRQYDSTDAAWLLSAIWALPWGSPNSFTEQMAYLLEAKAKLVITKQKRGDF